LGKFASGFLAGGSYVPKPAHAFDAFLSPGNIAGLIGMPIGAGLSALHAQKLAQDKAMEAAREQMKTPFEKAMDEAKALEFKPGTKQEKSLAAARILQQFGSAMGLHKDKSIGNIAGENQRFLQQGRGPEKSPELTTLEKIQKAIEEMAERNLPDLVEAVKK